MRRYLIFRLAVLALVCVVSTHVSAAWIEASGTVKRIMSYSTTDTVLVQLTSNGASVSECSNPIDFAISKSISAERRQRLYSQLLAAKMSGSTVVIAYNETGSCEPWGSNTNAYRQIMRLR